MLKIIPWNGCLVRFGFQAFRDILLFNDALVVLLIDKIGSIDANRK